MSCWRTTAYFANLPKQLLPVSEWDLINHSAEGTINYYRADSTEDMQQQSVKGVNSYHMEYLSICMWKAVKQLGFS